MGHRVSTCGRGPEVPHKALLPRPYLGTWSSVWARNLRTLFGLPWCSPGPPAGHRQWMLLQSPEAPTGEQCTSQEKVVPPTPGSVPALTRACCRMAWAWDSWAETMGPLEPASPPPPKRNCRVRQRVTRGPSWVPAQDPGAEVVPIGLSGDRGAWRSRGKHPVPAPLPEHPALSPSRAAPAPPASFSPGAMPRFSLCPGAFSP